MSKAIGVIMSSEVPVAIAAKGVTARESPITPIEGSSDGLTVVVVFFFLFPLLLLLVLGSRDVTPLIISNPSGKTLKLFISPFGSSSGEELSRSDSTFFRTSKGSRNPKGLFLVLSSVTSFWLSLSEEKGEGEEEEILVGSGRGASKREGAKG